MTNSPVSLEAAGSELQRRRNARRSLLLFTTYTKPDYEVSWHHKLICDFLDRFVNGEIKRMIISMPPRHGKSELVSRRLPAYIFGKFPDKSIISCSYSADLSSRMNRDVQRIIDAPEYSRLFPGTKLSDANIRSQGSYLRNSDTFEIVNHNGVYRSAGVGGGITGMGCDIGIIDDPVKNREEALSTTYRDNVWEWYTSTFYTRLEKDAQILVTMTRWHEDDLVGRILQNDGDNWVQLTLPALSTDSIAPYDQRTATDIPLWENKYDAASLATIRTVLGMYQWEALYQQHPTPEGGGMWKYDDIENNRVAYAPELTRIIVGVDPAVTSGSNSDETGIVVAGIAANGQIYVLADKSLKGTPAEWGSRVVTAYHEYNADRVIAEVNNGGEIIESMLRNIDRNIPYESVRASRGKQIRAEPIAALYEQGKVHHVGRFPRLEEQMCNWLPGEKSPDRMDALVWAISHLSEKPAPSGIVVPFMCNGPDGFHCGFDKYNLRSSSIDIGHPPQFGSGWGRWR